MGLSYGQFPDGNCLRTGPHGTRFVLTHKLVHHCGLQIPYAHKAVYALPTKI